MGSKQKKSVTLYLPLPPFCFHFYWKWKCLLCYSVTVVLWVFRLFRLWTCIAVTRRTRTLLPWRGYVSKVFVSRSRCWQGNNKTVVSEWLCLHPSAVKKMEQILPKDWCHQLCVTLKCCQQRARHVPIAGCVWSTGWELKLSSHPGYFWWT